jgi:hypothetical protein
MFKRTIFTAALVMVANTASARIVANAADPNALVDNALIDNGIEPNRMEPDRLELGTLIENGQVILGASTVARQRSVLRGVSIELPTTTLDAN